MECKYPSKDNESSLAAPYSLSNAIYNFLDDLRGDILTAVLFLPVALALQKLADKIIIINAIDAASILSLMLQMLKVGYILGMFLLEVFALSILLLNMKNLAVVTKVVALVFVLTVMSAITTLGFVLKIDDTKIAHDVLLNFNLLFRAVFFFSMIISFGGLYLLDKDERIEITHDNMDRFSVVAVLALLPYFIAWLP